MKVKNNGKCVISIGNVDLIPGAEPVVVADEWSKHTEVMVLVEESVLEVTEAAEVPADGKKAAKAGE